MKASEINITHKESCLASYGSREHYAHLLYNGSFWPTTKSQKKRFISENYGLGILGMKDINKVESLLNEHGFEGNYKKTKSGTWAKLTNQDDLVKAMKMSIK